MDSRTGHSTRLAVQLDLDGRKMPGVGPSMGLPPQGARKQLCVSNDDALRRNMGKIIASALVHKDPLDQNVGKHDVADKARATTKVRATYADESVSAINPAHYRQGSGVECIDVVRYLPFSQGNAMKYVWRAGHKDDIKQDLDKALWYVNDCIAQKSGVPIMEVSAEGNLLNQHSKYLHGQGDYIRMNTLWLLGYGDMESAAAFIKNWLKTL